MVAKPEFNSIEKVLEALPTDLLQHFTLFYQSESQQDASYVAGEVVAPGNPRVILFGKDAEMLIAFNGDPRERGFNKLEVIQYREAAASFEFVEIEFFPDSGLSPVPHRDPPECGGCHHPHPQMGLRPNWGAYKFWSGNYGSFDDFLPKVDAGSFRNGGMVRADYDLFRKGQPTHPRYRHLVMNNIYATYPFLSSIPGKVKGNEYPEHESGFYYYTRRPNLTLTKLLARRQAKRVARYISTHKLFPERGRKFMAELLGCNDVAAMAANESKYYAARGSCEHARESLNQEAILFGLSDHDIDLYFDEGNYYYPGFGYNDGGVCMWSLTAAALEPKFREDLDIAPLLGPPRNYETIYSPKKSPAEIDPTPELLEEERESSLILNHIDETGQHYGRGFFDSGSMSPQQGAELCRALERQK